MGDVFIEDGVIVENEIQDAEVLDGTGKILFPGLIDPHVHFRDPGLTHKEIFLPDLVLPLREA